MIGSSFLLIRGLVGILAGFAAFMWPGVTIAVLVALFGAYAIIDGATNVFIGLTRTSTHDRSWAVAIQGFVGIAAGIVAFLRPGLTALALLWVIGAWAVITGVFEVVAAIRLRREIQGEWLLGLSGTLSIAFGVLLFVFPEPGAVAIAWLLGAYAAASGAILIALAMRLRTVGLLTA
jgi:uncharacterized membrane protein HdeD (DUF308 family)